MNVFFKKKTALILLTLVLIITAASGCGSQKARDTSTESKSTTQATQAESVKAENESSAATTSSVVKPIEMDMYVNHTWWPLKEWAGPVPEEITKRTGVTFKITVAADDKQLALMIASGDLPEIVYTDNRQNMQKRLSDPNLCYSWNELIEKYAPDFVIEKGRSALYTQLDGKFYTILNNFSTKDEWVNAKYALPGAGGMALRKDILDKLGNPQINTLDDLSNTFGMVKKQFPDLIPLIMNTNWTGLGGQSSYFLNEFGLMIGGFPDDGTGKVVYYIKQPGRLDYYKYINSLYRKGYIIAENYSFKNEDQSFEYPRNLKCFAYMKGNTAADGLNIDMKKLGKNVEWIQIIKPLSERFKAFYTSIGWSGVFITKKNKHPKEAINLMKYLYSEEGQRLAMWGIEGKHWNMAPEGYPVFAEELADSSFVEKEGIRWWGLLIGSAVTEGIFNYNPTNKQSVDAAVEIKKRMVYDPALGMLSPEPDSTEQSTLTKLNDMVKNEEVKIFLAKTEDECVKAYENMLQLAERIGMAELEKWANNKYKEVQVLFK